MSELLCYDIFDSPVGPLTMVLSEAGLRALEFGRHQHSGCVPDALRLAPWRRQLKEYFERRREQFTLPLDLRGTDFQRSCWLELLKIPYGQTRSYKDIAEAIRKPKAVRAVGLANGQNPIAIVVPCHRVIGSDGTLTGYGGGLHVKEELLRLEGARLF
ncbi:MAG: methylated-DNA--[protein]-cysteine S-methyltransferase [Terriglobales bacterium]